MPMFESCLHHGTSSVTSGKLLTFSDSRFPLLYDQNGAVVRIL